MIFCFNFDIKPYLLSFKYSYCVYYLYFQKPEGTKKTYNIPFTVELSVDNPSFQMDVPIVLPSSNDGLVPDSVKVRVSATGKLLGTIAITFIN